MGQKLIQRPKGAEEEAIESKTIESLIPKEKLEETKELLEKTKKFVKSLEKKELLLRLKEEGTALDKLGLLVEMPFVSLTDLSDFSLILRDSIQDILSISGANRRIVDPAAEKIKHPGSIEIIVNLDISTWEIIAFTSLHLIDLILKNYNNVRAIFQDTVKSKFFKRMRKRFRKWWKSTLNTGIKKPKIIAFVVIVDSKTQKIKQKVEVFRSDSN